MSYDIFVFRPKPGMSMEAINEFIASDAASNENADPEEIAGHYIDLDMEHDELTRLAAGPLINALFDQDFAQDEIDDWIDDPDSDSDLGDCMDTILEDHEGYQIMVPIAEGSSDRRLPERLWDAFEELHDRGLVVLDPQMGRMLDMKDDHEEFVECFKETCAAFEEIERDFEDDDDYGDEGDEDY